MCPYETTSSTASMNDAPIGNVDEFSGSQGKGEHDKKRERLIKIHLAPSLSRKKTRLSISAGVEEDGGQRQTLVSMAN